VPNFGVEYPGHSTEQPRWFSMVVTPLGDGAVVTHTEITEYKLAEERLRLAASVFSHAREGIMIAAADGTIVDVNETFTHITGYGRGESIGKSSDFLASGQHGPEFYTGLWNEVNEKGHWYGEVWNRRKNGELFAAMQTVSSVRDTQDSLHHYVVMFSDITSLKAYQKQLQHIAHYDVLTALPNRALLADRLRQAITQASRHKQLLAVAYLDLDGFKEINDRHGHDTGDKLLRTVASRMKHAMREGDTLARLGGDEFVAVLVDLADEATSVPMLGRLLAAAALPVPIDELLLRVSASIGVAFYPQAGEVDADLLLRQADQAMYQAKLAGKNRYHVFDAEQDRTVRGHHESLERIRRALTAGEFVLHYQPKVNVREGKVTGAEALIRWQHPDRGLLGPEVFLPVIENHALAIEVGDWVLNTALNQIATWRAAGLKIPVSVNVGTRQLQQADFVEHLRILLAAHPGVSPGDLELEVLETSALQDLTRASEVIEECRKIGVTFSLDDFGTGYSSLTYLKRLPVKQLKIDQSFVCGMLDDPDDLAILESVLSLAIAFQRQVTAEGVETVEHGEMLLQLGCELAQGFGIARPMPADELPAWAAAWRPDPLWIGVPPINHADLPLLFAGAEYRAWIAMIASYLRGDRKTLPTNHQDYRFGTWLATEGLAHHGGHPAFQNIVPLQRQLHALAAELLELRDDGRLQQALDRLPALFALRDALLEQLRTLMLGNRA
jgi:diguanylate cyclase (GGDEF)-like protein/PAS domain S-box-containing protein